MADPRQWGRGNRKRITTRAIPATVQDLVTERMGKACAWAPSGCDGPLELDHIQALSRGGDNHHLNLRWMCRRHNRGRRAGRG